MSKTKKARKMAKTIVKTFNLPSFESVYVEEKRTVKIRVSPIPGIEEKHWPRVRTVTLRLGACYKGIYKAIRKNRLSEFMGEHGVGK